jgi:hypothetical protein
VRPTRGALPAVLTAFAASSLAAQQPLPAEPSAIQAPPGYDVSVVAQGLHAQPNTGVVWKVTRTAGAPAQPMQLRQDQTQPPAVRERMRKDGR